MPIDPAINIIKRKLELDQELHLRTTMPLEQIISLVEFCLGTTYFQFQGRFYENYKEQPWGLQSAPLWPTSSSFGIKAINTAEHPLRIWRRFVEDTFVVIESAKKEKFLEHINKMDPHIRFATEDAKADGSFSSWIQ